MITKILTFLFVICINLQTWAQDCPNRGPQDETYGGGGDEFPPDSLNNSDPDYEIPILVAIDPNDIIGPTGYGEPQWISPGQLLDYTIRFENDPDFATAPAQVVKINHPLDSHININSLRLGDFGFGNFTFKVPANSSFYQRTLDVTDSLGVLVNVTAGIDVNRREAFWIFESLDPVTGLPPEDALIGFLPVNDTTASEAGNIGKGEGFVNFTVQANKGLDRLDSIAAQAFIIFDINAPLATNIWVNQLDPLPPVSKITSIEDTGNQVYHIHTQSGDEGSGLESYDLYYSVNSGPLRPLATDLRDQSLYVFDTGVKDSTYCFVTLARDFAGNLEAFKSLGENCISLSDAPAPEISSFSPPSGPTGTSVTIHGKYFTGASSVKFNGKEAEFSAVNSETILAIVPPEAGTGPITVTAPGGVVISKASFTFEITPPNKKPPVISEFTPAKGAVGTVVTISGKNFTGVTTVAFNGKTAVFTIINDETITATVPAEADTGPIQITNAAGAVTSKENFVVEQPQPGKTPPIVNSFTPEKGSTGTSVTVKGKYFSNTSEVSINGKPATFTIVDDETLTVTVPDNAGTGLIRVTNGDGSATSATQFVYEVPVVEKYPPVLSGFSPAKGIEGTVVTLTGKYFTGVTEVTINGKSLEFTVVNDETITVVIPKDLGTGPILITNADGTVSSASDFEYDLVTGIIREPLEKIITLFPNPTTGQFTIMTTDTQFPSGEVNIMDAQGKSVKTIDLSKVRGPEITVDISHVAAGTYFIYLESDGEKWTQRLVKK